MLKSFRPELRSAARNFLHLLCLLLLALTVLPDNSRPAFSDEPSIFPGETVSDSDLAFVKELKRSADEISARELNECHLALLGRMLLASPDVLQLKLHYGGIIRDKGNNVITLPKSGREIYGGSRLHGSIGSPLQWSVSSEKNFLAIFSMSITVRKADRTVAEIPLKKRTLYVNVDFVDGNDKITKKRDDLGGVSVLEFVKRLEKGPSDLEKTE